MPVSQELIQKAVLHPDQILSCMHFHKGINCNTKMISQFISGSRSLSKMYMIVHLVPFLLFKRKKLKQNPKNQLVKLFVAFAKSMLFAGGYSALVRRTICFYTTVHTSQGGKLFLLIQVSCMLGAIVASLTLTFEPVSRQSEIALFCLNKTMETSYNMLIRRKYPAKIPHGDALLVAVALAVISYHYFNNKESIRSNYLKMLDKLLSSS